MNKRNYKLFKTLFDTYCKKDEERASLCKPPFFIKPIEGNEEQIKHIDSQILAIVEELSIIKLI